MAGKHLINLKNNTFTLSAAWLQSVYYIITGVWPLVSISTFTAVTGYKTDVWLVKMVGLLVIAIGITIFSAAKNKAITKQIVILAVLSAISFTAIDVYYSFTDRISNIYLADAFLEIVLLLLWTIGIFKKPHNSL